MNIFPESETTDRKSAVLDGDSGHGPGPWALASLARTLLSQYEAEFRKEHEQIDSWTGNQHGHAPGIGAMAFDDDEGGRRAAHDLDFDAGEVALRQVRARPGCDGYRASGLRGLRAYRVGLPVPGRSSCSNGFFLSQKQCQANEGANFMTEKRQDGAHEGSSNDTSTGTAEFKAVAREALHLGTRGVNAARDWFNQRSQAMRHRNEQWQNDGNQEQAAGRRGAFGAEGELSGYPEQQGGRDDFDSQFGNRENSNRGRQEELDDSVQRRGRREQSQSAMGGRFMQDYDDYGSRGSRGSDVRNYGQGGMGRSRLDSRGGEQDHGRGQGKYDQENFSQEAYGQGSSSYPDRGGTGGYGQGAYGDDGRPGAGRGGFSRLDPIDEDRNRSGGFDRYDQSGRGRQGYGWSSDQGGSNDFRQGNAQRNSGLSGHGRQSRGQEPRSSGAQSDVFGSGYGGHSASGSHDQDHWDQSQARTQQDHRGRGPKNYTRSDERLLEDLSEKLSEDPLIDASEISVEVKQGVVTLSGTVEKRWMKHQAEDLAERCSGVKDVENNIKVKRGSEWDTGSGSGSSGGEVADATGSGSATLSAGTGRGSSPGASQAGSPGVGKGNGDGGTSGSV
jgi:osmotically-inducible protein OsmY